MKLFLTIANTLILISLGIEDVKASDSLSIQRSRRCIQTVWKKIDDGVKLGKIKKNDSNKFRIKLEKKCIDEYGGVTEKHNADLKKSAKGNKNSTVTKDNRLIILYQSLLIEKSKMLHPKLSGKKALSYMQEHGVTTVQEIMLLTAIISKDIISRKKNKVIDKVDAIVELIWSNLLILKEYNPSNAIYWRDIKNNKNKLEIKEFLDFQKNLHSRALVKPIETLKKLISTLENKVIPSTSKRREELTKQLMLFKKDLDLIEAKSHSLATYYFN